MSVEALAIVLNHSQARGAAKVVLLGIANHINPDNDGAWPSQARLASYANVSERAVRLAVDQLVGLGELRVEVNGGHSATQYKTNRYWLTLRCPDDCDGSTNHGRVEVFDGRVEVFDNQGGSLLPTNRNTTVSKPIHAQNEIDIDFDTFWKQYPRKVGKDAARRLFFRLHSAHRDDMLAGVARYASDPNLPPMQFVPHATTWLNRAGWDDEPLPERILTAEEKKAKEEKEAAERRERDRVKREQQREHDRRERERVEAEMAANPVERCEHDRILVLCKVCWDTPNGRRRKE